MSYDTEAIRHYQHLASYLINGDASGLSDADEKEADWFLKTIKETYGDSAEIVDCRDDPEFGMPEWGGLKGTVIDYTIRFDPSELPSDLWALEKDMEYLPRG